ncbi:hypothetical protein NDU88_006835 [Pleurodeles waltl]|uniref:Uncharacterized protein n=1 Tax=Pleurodeles waltl TaxID=8319 RepID=A0AAV7SQY0_PLEWA|nr:hypothetical protein NDU88_006835 [Pleurodeles waltl]
MRRDATRELTLHQAGRKTFPNGKNARAHTWASKEDSVLRHERALVVLLLKEIASPGKVIVGNATKLV